LPSIRRFSCGTNSDLYCFHTPKLISPQFPANRARRNCVSPLTAVCRCPFGGRAGPEEVLILPYSCLAFGWYYELLASVSVPTLAAGERELLRMLDGGGMIVHVYRDSDPDNPEVVGRHWRLRSFLFDSLGRRTNGELEEQHEVERFLLDAASADDWVRARETGQPLEERWSVVELWTTAAGSEKRASFGRARLISPRPA
jgi:hypothetical protein